MKKVLVLGGDEFIGGRVLQALASCGWARPVADPAAARKAQHANIDVLAFNLSDAASMALALRDVDAVVNCLSGRPKTIAQAAAVLFDTAPRCAKPPLVVLISSMSVYGPATGPVDENAPLQEGLAPYAQAKVTAEKLAAGYPRCVVVRPGCEFGPSGEPWSGRIAKWLYAGRIGDLGGAGDGYCNLVPVDDLAAGVLLALQQPAAIGQTFNLAMEHPPTWNEYFIAFAKALGAVPVQRITRRQLVLETKALAIPLKAAEIALRPLGLGAKLPPPIPPSLLSLMRQEIQLDSTRALQMLGWSSRPLNQAIAETAAWYRQDLGHLRQG